MLAHVHGPDPRHPAAATVVLGTSDLKAYPGAYIAVDGPVIAVRGHGTVIATVSSSVTAESDLDPALVAAALHTWVFQLGRAMPHELHVNGATARLEASPRR